LKLYIVYFIIPLFLVTIYKKMLAPGR